MKNKKTIVKVQIPIFTIHDGDTADVLVYNEDRSIQYVENMGSSELRELRRAVKGEDKAFFYFCTSCGAIDYDTPVDEQSW